MGFNSWKQRKLYRNKSQNDVTQSDHFEDPKLELFILGSLLIAKITEYALKTSYLYMEILYHNFNLGY